MTRMLTRDRFAVANILIMIFVSPSSIFTAPVSSDYQVEIY